MISTRAPVGCFGVGRWVTVVAIPDSAVDHEVASAAERVVLVADADMRYLAASDGACRMLGYSLCELLSMRVPDVVKETDAEQRYRRMIDERRQEGEITLICKDGRQVKARYAAREAHAEGVTYYVSELTPAGPVASARPNDSRM